MILRSLAPEAQLLFLTAGPAGNDARIAEILEGELDWRLLCALAARAKAAPIVWKRIEEIEGDHPSDAGRKHLRNHALVAGFRHAHLEQRFGEVMRLFQENGIDPVVLKGAALVICAYGSFQNRPMGDLDLLIEENQAESAQNLLRNRGWKAEYPPGASADQKDWRDEFYGGHHHLLPLLDPAGTGFAIELHTELFPPGNPFQLSAERIRERAETVAFEQSRIRIPCRAHQLLHLCLHLTWSHMMRSGAWRTFRDLQTLLDAGPVDWAELVRLARIHHAETCCYWTLRLARNLAGVAIPDEVCGTLRPRLPEAVLLRLEYHLSHEAVAFQPVCPSVRVREAMWSFAIRPRHSGHGAARPWLHAGDATLSPGANALAGSRKFWEHAHRLRDWAGYLGAMLSPPTPPAAAATRLPGT